MSLHIGIVAEGSLRIGAGHQVRMGVLARALRARGHRVGLWSRALAGSSHSWAWHGLPCTILAEQTALHDLLATAARNCDRLVIDHHAVSSAQFAAVPSWVGIVIIDDVPGRNLAGASMIVNQNFGVDTGEYPLPALVGPDYALVRSEFTTVTYEPKSDMLVMIGATDVCDINEEIALLLWGRYPHATIHVVTANEQSKQLDRNCILAHSRLDGEALAGLMARCRCAVLAASSSIYEALAVGMPFVAIRTVANQDRIASGLQNGRLAPVIPTSEWRHTADLVGQLPQRLPRLVDGRGAERVAMALEQS